MNDSGSYERALERLQTALLQTRADPELEASLEAGAEVLGEFQPIFSRDHLPELSVHEFHAFLLIENNRRWSGLHRLSPKITADMEQLRAALDLLLYGEGGIAGRLSQATAMVPGMGRAIATALLLIVYPERYGVWNTTSEGALKRLGLWPNFQRGTSLGEKYVEINIRMNHLAEQLDVDLWTLDAIWWTIEAEETIEKVEGEGPDEAPSSEQLFHIERHLQDFLWANWESTKLAREWERYTEEGNPDAGYEYPCGVGRIDLLARHKSRGDWLVIELKRGQTSDQTLGQILRYMGWVCQNLAEPGEQVKGLIIAHEVDERLRYALSVIPNVDLQQYEIEFRLRDIARMGVEV